MVLLFGLVKGFRRTLVSFWPGKPCREMFICCTTHSLTHTFMYVDVEKVVPTPLMPFETAGPERLFSSGAIFSSPSVDFLHKSVSPKLLFPILSLPCPPSMMEGYAGQCKSGSPSCLIGTKADQQLVQAIVLPLEVVKWSNEKGCAERLQSDSWLLAKLFSPTSALH